MTLVAIGILLAILRVAGVHSSAFMAVAHLFMGWLARDVVLKWKWREFDPTCFRRSVSVWLFAILCVVEVASAVYYRFFAVHSGNFS
jgi:hypothetical protein